MWSRSALVLVFFMLISQLVPGLVLARYSQPWSGHGWHSAPYAYSHYRGYGSHYSHYYHGDEAVFWGLTGLLLGSMIVAASLPPAYPPPQVVYSQPPLQVYTYPPAVPPGMCRWERYLLDGYGNYILDQYGQPVKQYTLGSCQYPPN